MRSGENTEEYLIEDFGSYGLGEDEEHTIRAGFFVCANFGEPSPFARCFEGYGVVGANGKEQVEPDTFNIAWVNVFNERRRGIGTALIARALTEAKERGFRVARMEVENPQVISVFRKIGQTGLIANVRYALTPVENEKLVNVIPTPRFNEHPSLMTSDEAAAYLGFGKHAINGMVLNSAPHEYEVECVMDLK